jgi:site-specific recombinase XerD
MQEAGVTKPGAIRILRHSFATGLMGRNANFRLVQGAMRHSSMDMTTNYAQIADPDLADLIDSRENSL